MTRIFEEVDDWFHRHQHHQPYNDPATPPATEAPVSLIDTIREEFGRAVNWGEDEFRKALPTVAKAADTAEAVATSGAATAILDAVLSPEDDAFIARLVQKLDQGIDKAAENLHAGGSGTTQVTINPDVGDLPQAPEPQPVAAGPVVGGQAQ